MRMRTNAWGAAAAAVSLLATSLLVPLGAAAVPSHPPVWDKGAGGERYVALGDSFASGPGIAPQRATCSRSELNFPTLVATALDVNSFVDASCGGARTVDLTAAQTRNGAVVNAPQLDALGPDTTLVTFGTMGGNDLGLVQLATSCVVSDCGPQPGDDARFADVKTALTDGVEEAARRAPSAEIVMVGYGVYLPENGCPAAFGGALTAAESNFVQGSIDRLSDVVAEVAREKSLTFIDLRLIPGAAERTVCAPANQQWIRGLNTFDDGSTLHPSACGMKAMAQQVVSTVKIARGETPDVFDASCVSAGPGAEPTVEPSPVPTPQPEPTAAPSTAPTTAPTTPPTVAPAPAPVPAPTRAQRLERLKAHAATVKVKATCQGRPEKSRATLRVTGGKGSISKVTFRAGTKKVAVDRKAPWRTTKKASTLRKQLKKKSSTVRAVVTLRDGDLRITRTVVATRPKCLKR